MKKQHARSTGTVERGITLIALVITIILLFLLAGIALQAFTGSGLFEQATSAKEKAKLSEIGEKLKLTVIEIAQEKERRKSHFR